MAPLARTKRTTADSRLATACGFFKVLGITLIRQMNLCYSGSGRPFVSGMNEITTTPQQEQQAQANRRPIADRCRATISIRLRTKDSAASNRPPLKQMPVPVARR